MQPEYPNKIPSKPGGLPVGWVRATGLLVFLSLILQHGFPFGHETVQTLNFLDSLLAAVLFADLVVAVVKGKSRKQVIYSRSLEFLLLATLVLLLVTCFLLPENRLLWTLSFFQLETRSQLVFNLVQIYLLISLCIQILQSLQGFIDRGTRPELILAGSFATLVVVGGFLLLLPNSSARSEAPISLMDAFFTSTSAVCVTGLIVRDTGTDFSTFGQMVIMVLIQMGGLGIITFVAFLSIFSARSLPVPQLVLFRQLVNAPTLSDVKRLILGIVLVTVVVEVIGAVLIHLFLPESNVSLESVRWSLFHSISAFCNAGFAFQPDSLVAFQSNTGMMVVFMTLIVLGGMGFLVLSELLGYRITRSRFFRRIAFFRRFHAGHPSKRLSLQSQFALRVSALLLLIGFIGFGILEWNRILGEHPVGDRLLISAFQSVTPRTAGFNTVPIEDLRDATLILLIALMVVGASPMSMGGGIKTVTFGILLLALRALVFRREAVEVFGRCIPVRTLLAALSAFVLYVMCASAGIFQLSVFDPQMSLQDQVFEMISALSTVGLSTGITAELSVPSQVVLCVAMFIGRVGPIALVLSVFKSSQRTDYDFPQEDVVVG